MKKNKSMETARKIADDAIDKLFSEIDSDELSILIKNLFDFFNFKKRFRGNEYCPIDALRSLYVEYQEFNGLPDYTDNKSLEIAARKAEEVRNNLFSEMGSDELNILIKYLFGFYRLKIKLEIYLESCSIDFQKSLYLIYKQGIELGHNIANNKEDNPETLHALLKNIEEVRTMSSEFSPLAHREIQNMLNQFKKEVIKCLEEVEPKD